MNLTTYGPYILIIFGAVFSTAGVIWQSKLDEGELRATKSALVERNEELKRLNNFILSSVTGGSSYCLFGIGNCGKDRCGLSVASKGEFGVFDVNARVVDVDEFLTQPLSMDNLHLWEKNYALGNLAAGDARLIDVCDLTGRDALRLNIFITARNGSVTQVYRLRKRDGVWKRATRVFRKEGNKEVLLLESVEPGYPSSDLVSDADWAIGAQGREGQRSIAL